MKTLTRPRVVAKYLLITLVFISNLLFPFPTQAATTIAVSIPEEVEQQQAFEMQLDISAQAETSYYLKTLIGANLSQALTHGQTLNAETNTWLGYNDAWNKFPMITTDDQGVWSGKLTSRASSSSTLGTSYLVVRIRSVSGTNTDSSPITLTINAPPAPKVTTSQGKPVLNEFMASGNEWVEIKNIGKQDADISGWFIDDEPGKSSPTLVPSGTIIKPGKYFVLYLPSAKLNDSVDSIRLLKPNGTQVEKFSYSKVEKGKSWAKDSAGKWYLATSPSPGADNIANLIENSDGQIKAATNQEKIKKKLASEAERELDESPLPLLFGNYATTSASTAATVSGNFTDKNLQNQVGFNLIFILIGITLLFLSLAFYIQKKLLFLPNNDQQIG